MSQQDIDAILAKVEYYDLNKREIERDEFERKHQKGMVKYLINNEIPELLLRLKEWELVAESDNDVSLDLGDLQEISAAFDLCKEQLEQSQRPLGVHGSSESPLSIAVEALEKLARLGNGGELGNSDGNMIARTALTKLRQIT